MSETTSSTGADIKWGGEVVAQDGRSVGQRVSLLQQPPGGVQVSRQTGRDARHINHYSWPETVPIVNFQVVPIRPLASSTVSIIGIGRSIQVSSGSPVKIRKANHALERREGAIWGNIS